MKHGMLGLLLLSGCWDYSNPPPITDYALTWTCLSPEGCERTEEVERIDRVRKTGRDYHFTSTQDESFAADATAIASDFLPSECSWLYFLTLFGYELDRPKLCFAPGSFEIELSIPNQDPTTHSLWLIEGTRVDLL